MKRARGACRGTRRRSGRAGGGDGGEIELDAGEDSLGGIHVGGGVAVGSGSLSLQASQASAFGGDGGGLDVEAAGPIYVDSAVPIRAGASVNFEGSGGSVSFHSGDDSDAVGPLDGTLELQGQIIARSGALGGFGGDLEAVAGRSLTIGSAIDLGGKDGGGEVSAGAGNGFVLTGAITADATSSTGSAGTFAVDACTVDVRSSGMIAVPGQWGGRIELIGRNQVTVSASSTVTAGTGGSNRLVTRTVSAQNPNTGGTMSQFAPAPVVVADPTLGPCSP